LIDSVAGVIAKINNLTLTPITQWSSGIVKAIVPSNTPRGTYTNPWIGFVLMTDTIGLDTASTSYKNYVVGGL
jgi:hypothetical protein